MATEQQQDNANGGQPDDDNNSLEDIPQKKEALLEPQLNKIQHMEVHLGKRFAKMDKKNKRYADEHRPKQSYMDPKLSDLNNSIQTHFNKLTANQ